MALEVKLKVHKSCPLPKSNPRGCHVKGICWIPEPNMKAARNLWERESDNAKMKEKWIQTA